MTNQVCGAECFSISGLQKECMYSFEGTCISQRGSDINSYKYTIILPKLLSSMTNSCLLHFHAFQYKNLINIVFPPGTWLACPAESWCINHFYLQVKFCEIINSEWQPYSVHSIRTYLLQIFYVCHYLSVNHNMPTNSPDIWDKCNFSIWMEKLLAAKINALLSFDILT